MSNPLDCKFCRTTCNGREIPCASLAAAKDCPWMSRSDWDALDEALAQAAQSRPGTAGAWTADEFWQYVGGLAGEWEAGEMRRMMHERGLALSPQDGLADPTNHHNALKCPYCNPNGIVAERAAVIEECAKFVEQHQERITETSNGSERSVSPRMAGNQMGLAYAAAIRALAPKGAADGTVKVSEEALRNCGCPSDRRGTVGDCQDSGQCGCSLPRAEGGAK